MNVKPMLAHGKLLIMDIPLSDISFPMYASIKYNGVRSLLRNGIFYGRNGEPLRINPDVLFLFSHVVNYATENNLLLDGEFSSNSHNTVGETLSILAGTVAMPADFSFKVIYSIPLSLWDSIYAVVIKNILPRPVSGVNRLSFVSHHLVNTADEFLAMVELNKSKNLEGFILVSPCGNYKHGRATLSENLMFKYKYYGDDEDAYVVGLTRRRERVSSAPQERWASGKAKQTHREEHFMDTDTAGCMICKNESGSVIHVPFPFGWNLEKRKQAYEYLGSGCPEDILGKWITFKRLVCENRDKPIAIKNVQFRDSKGVIK